MKALIIITGTGPILVLTSYESPKDKGFIEKLKSKGINKFVAYHMEMDKVKERYGKHFTVVMRDLHETDDMRVLDYDGHHIFMKFSFDEFGDPTNYEPTIFDKPVTPSYYVPTSECESLQQFGD
ncbi:MAG: hypothetical protein AB2L11_10875 [Syntrophobacteraceae bacterium]